MVGSCLLDQRDTEVQLVEIVQNLIDPRYNFASMFLEGLVNMLIISDEIWIHEGKHVDDLAVRLKDAEILCIWFFFNFFSSILLYKELYSLCLHFSADRFPSCKKQFSKKDFLQIKNVHFFPSNISLQLPFIQPELLLVASESRELSVIVDCVFLGAAEEILLQRAVTRPHHGPSIIDGHGPVSILYSGLIFILCDLRYKG